MDKNLMILKKNIRKGSSPGFLSFWEKYCPPNYNLNMMQCTEQAYKMWSKLNYGNKKIHLNHPVKYNDPSSDESDTNLGSPRRAARKALSKPKNKSETNLRSPRRSPCRTLAKPKNESNTTLRSPRRSPCRALAKPKNESNTTLRSPRRSPVRAPAKPKNETNTTLRSPRSPRALAKPKNESNTALRSPRRISRKALAKPKKPKKPIKPRIKKPEPARVKVKRPSSVQRKRDLIDRPHSNCYLNFIFSYITKHKELNEQEIISKAAHTWVGMTDKERDVYRREEPKP